MVLMKNVWGVGGLECPFLDRRSMEFDIVTRVLMKSERGWRGKVSLGGFKGKLLGIHYRVN